MHQKTENWLAFIFKEKKLFEDKSNSQKNKEKSLPCWCMNAQNCILFMFAQSPIYIYMSLYIYICVCVYIYINIYCCFCQYQYSLEGSS